MYHFAKSWCKTSKKEHTIISKNDKLTEIAGEWLRTTN
jgi:hypothetical protein